MQEIILNGNQSLFLPKENKMKQKKKNSKEKKGGILNCLFCSFQERTQINSHKSITTILSTDNIFGECFVKYIHL